MNLFITRTFLFVGLQSILILPLFGQITESGQQAYFTFDGNINDRKLHLAAQCNKNPAFDPSRIGADPGAFITGDNQLIIRDTAKTIDFSGKKDFALSFWLRISNRPKSITNLLSNVRQITSKEPYFRLEADTNGIPVLKLKFGRRKNELMAVSGSKQIADNKWHHFVIIADIRDSLKSIKVFIDNRTDISAEFKGAGIYPSSDLIFGEENQTGIANLLLDDLRCYSNKIYPVDIGQLYYEGLTVNYNMVFLKNSNLPDNSSTIMTGLDANREKVLFNISKHHYLKGYSIRIIDLKRKERCFFPVESDKYEFEIVKWGGPGQYFMEVIDEENNLYQVFKIQFRNSN